MSIFDVLIGVYSFHMTVIEEDRQNPVSEFRRRDSRVWTLSLISERDRGKINMIVLTVVSTKDQERGRVSLKDESVSPLNGKFLVLCCC